MKSRWAASLTLAALWLLFVYPVKSHRKRRQTAERKTPAAHPCAPGVGGVPIPELQGWGHRQYGNWANKGAAPGGVLHHRPGRNSPSSP